MPSTPLSSELAQLAAPSDVDPTLWQQLRRVRLDALTRLLQPKAQPQAPEAAPGS